MSSFFGYFLEEQGESTTISRDNQVSQVDYRALCGEESDPYSHYYGLNGYTVDYKRAMACAQLGSSQSMWAFDMAIHIMAYANGQGVKRSLEEAIFYAELDRDAAPAAKSIRIQSLKEIKASCAVDQTSQACLREYNYFSDTTSGRAWRFHRHLLNKLNLSKLERSLVKDIKNQEDTSSCREPKRNSIEEYLYDYKVLSNNEILLISQSRKLSIRFDGLGTLLRESDTKPKQLVYIDQYMYKVLFPYSDPLIDFQGSAGIPYLDLNWYLINRKLGRGYIYPVTNKGGNLVYFWSIDGAKYGDSFIVLDLQTGKTKVIGDYSYQWASVTLERDTYDSRVDLQLDLGSGNTELRLFEVIDGVGIKINEDQKLFQTIDPITLKLGTCRSSKTLKEK